MLIAPDRHPDRTQGADLIRHDPEQGPDLLTDKGREHDEAGSRDGGITLRDHAVAAKCQMGVRHDLVEPFARFDGDHYGNVADIAVRSEFGLRCRQAVTLTVSLRTYKIDRGLADLLADKARNLRIEKTQI